MEIAATFRKAAYRLIEKELIVLSKLCLWKDQNEINVNSISKETLIHP